MPADGVLCSPVQESFGLSSRVNGSAWAAPPTNVDAAEMTGRLSTAQATRQHRLSGTSVKPSRHKAQHERFDYGPTSKSHIRATKTGHVNPADYEWQQFDEDDVPLATQPLYLVSNPKLRVRACTDEQTAAPTITIPLRDMGLTSRRSPAERSWLEWVWSGHYRERAKAQLL